MLSIIKNNQGVAALVAAIVITAAALSITLSATITSLNKQVGINSFDKSLQAFYSAESGVGEALMQLRREPNNFIFADFSVAGYNVSSEFVDDPACSSNCPSVIEATASSTVATRKVQYTCDNDITNCTWRELTP